MLGGGDLVDDRYRLARVLGEGAAGAVWLAHDERRDIDVALKILRPNLAATKAMIERFVREADLSERMLSPHIVRVLARGATAEGAPYIAYERLEGQDLGARIGPNGRLALEGARTAVVHTCRALTRAHAIGVLHRDIKPENLFVTSSDGRMLLKVVDFGVAELVGSVDRDGPMVGTIDYLAPEVVLGERAPSVQSDLFAVGVVAYQALSGATPFRGGNVGQLVLAHATTTPKSLHAFDARIPPEVDAWMERALARRPEDRFESAREMAAAFERAVAVVNVKATGVLPRFDSRALRRPETSRYVIVAPRDGKEK